ncbi:MAG: TfoX/Sxy family protein [Actinobacteria bacterium]|nr:TfoX/Sxy family protein [Actinomycetota bacterium]MBU1944281.1 TfoX/Sxy family protein [Actinomycetota bacterium]MBU2688257.1 TfoX/Sxy family protein [Actinomycetota bacterium]
MAWGDYSARVKEVLDDMLLGDPEVEPRKAFGYPSYSVNGKMFACVYGDGVSIKLPAERAAELVEGEGYALFEPMEGRKMREWVVVSHADPEEFRADADLLKESLDYVYHASKSK